MKHLRLSRDSKTEAATAVFRQILFPVFAALLLFWIYIRCLCLINSSSSCTDLICSVQPVNVIILHVTYILAQCLARILPEASLLKKIAIPFSVYSLAVALIALLIWLSRLPGTAEILDLAP